MLNKVQLIGYLGQTPEIRQTKEGQEMAIFSLATYSSCSSLSKKHPENELSKNESSEKASPSKRPVLRDKLKEELNGYLWKRTTEWHRITVLRATLVMWIKEHLHRGDLVFVEGKLSYDKRQDNSTPNQRSATIVISGWENNIKLLRSQKLPLLKKFSLKEPLKEAEEEAEKEEEDNTSLSIQRNILGDSENDK